MKENGVKHSDPFDWESVVKNRASADSSSRRRKKVRTITEDPSM